MAKPGNDLDTQTVEFKGETLEVKKTFKVHKFFKAVEKSPFTAIDMILTDESVEKLDEMEFTIPELGDLLRAITEALGVDDLKN